MTQNARRAAEWATRNLHRLSPLLLIVLAAVLTKPMLGVDPVEVLSHTSPGIQVDAYLAPLAAAVLALFVTDASSRALKIVLLLTAAVAVLTPPIVIANTLLTMRALSSASPSSVSGGLAEAFVIVPATLVGLVALSVAGPRPVRWWLPDARDAAVGGAVLVVLSVGLVRGFVYTANTGERSGISGAIVGRVMGGAGTVMLQGANTNPYAVPSPDTVPVTSPDTVAVSAPDTITAAPDTAAPAPVDTSTPVREAVRPEPPRASTRTRAASSDNGDVYYDFQVDKLAAPMPGNEPPAYPPMLRVANVEGEVVAQFVVDTTGRADMTTFKVSKSSHELFTAAVATALRRMRFSPAEMKGRKVKQLVEMPFPFNLSHE